MKAGPLTPSRVISTGRKAKHYAAISSPASSKAPPTPATGTLARLARQGLKQQGWKQHIIDELLDPEPMGVFLHEDAAEKKSEHDQKNTGSSAAATGHIYSGFL